MHLARYPDFADWRKDYPCALVAGRPLRGDANQHQRWEGGILAKTLMEESQEDLDPFSPKKLGKQETTKVPRFEKLSLMLLKPSCRLCKSDSSSWGSHCKPDRWFPLLLRRYSVVSRYQITNSPPRLLALWRSNWSLTGRTWNALPCSCLCQGKLPSNLYPIVKAGRSLTCGMCAT